MTNELKSGQRSDAVDVRYRVYIAPEGCDMSYCGEYDTLEAAQAAADGEPRGLAKSLWDTARNGGPCYGLDAPRGGTEDDEPISWHGADGCHCVVRVIH